VKLSIFDISGIKVSCFWHIEIWELKRIEVLSMAGENEAPALR